jgi:threonylcarbamoyladenosine tRNA methylthiotransferase MtaB
MGQHESTPTGRTCRLLTLGCKVNQYETQYVKELLEANGYREALDGHPADLCIINTCTVTHEADAKGRQLIRRTAQSNPNAAVVVMGCFATRDPDTVRRLPGVTKVITDKNRLAEELHEFGVVTTVRGISRFDGHQRAFVKVQDGCLLNCSFCIIPSVRPVLVSRPIADIAAEVTRLIEGGCEEIVLTGIHLGHYGIDLSKGKPKDKWCRLWHLIRRLDELPGTFRVRLSSLEAAEVPGELVEALANSTRVCPHLHLCLQSGSDRILGLMKRRYRAASFLQRCRRLREVLDQPAFTTDVIVGFPSETDNDFEETCRVIEEVGFSKLHIFSYSARKGTPAANLGHGVSPGKIAERRRRLLELEASLSAAFYRSLLARQLDVLVEGNFPDRPGYVIGTSCRYAPVFFRGHLPALLARRIPVIAREIVQGRIFATSMLEGNLESSVESQPSRLRISLPQVAVDAACAL